MKLTKQMLKNTFDKAKETGSPFVFVAINAEGTDEVIAIPSRSFETKESFYDKAYNDDLVHVMNSKVYIRGFGRGYPEDLNDLI